MIRYDDIEQGSPEWDKVRTGIPTSSNFGRIITPTGKPSTQADEYINRCIADMICGGVSERFEKSVWMERGIDMEQEAADWYELETGRDLIKVGFVTDDLGRWGASPDRIVVEGGKEIGAVEIKCPAPWTHIENLLRGTIQSKYTPQVQGQMFIGGFAWVDWVSYHPDFGGMIWRAERDEEYIETLARLLADFDEQKKERLDRLNGLGITTGE